MQTVELLVKADDWNKAISLLGDIGIHEKRQSHYRPMNGLFIVTATCEEPLSADQYVKIYRSPDISVISDSDSQGRAAVILEKIYEVETQLRKLLLHTSELVEPFFEIFSEKSEYSNGFAKEKLLSRSKDHNPITSQLTFGETIDILGYDLSWSSKNLSASDIEEVLSQSESFEAFKSKVSQKMKPIFVWDIISKYVLNEPSILWSSIYPDLVELKEFRNKSAHHKVVTPKDKRVFVEKANNLITKLTPAKKLTRQQLNELQAAALKASEAINKHMSQITTINHSALQALAKSASLQAKMPTNRIAEAMSRAYVYPRIDEIFKDVNKRNLRAINNLPTTSDYLKALYGESKPNKQDSESEN